MILAYAASRLRALFNPLSKQRMATSIQGFQPSQTPFYDRPPDFIPQHAYALATCALFISTSAAHLTFTKWSKPIDRDQESAKGSTAESDDKPAAVEYELRPISQRLFLAVPQLLFGFTAAIILPMTRKRTGRRIYILPPHPPPSSTSKTDLRRVLVQSLASGNHRDFVLPISNCRIGPGRDHNEVVLMGQNNIGHFWFGLDGVKINGKEVSVEKAKAKLMEVLNLGSKAKRISAGWVDGPILSRAAKS